MNESDIDFGPRPAGCGDRGITGENRPECPACGQSVVFAAAFHDDHRYVNSHNCRVKNETFVACACGSTAWGQTTDHAVLAMGGWRG